MSLEKIGKRMVEILREQSYHRKELYRLMEMEFPKDRRVKFKVNQILYGARGLHGIEKFSKRLERNDDLVVFEDYYRVKGDE